MNVQPAITGIIQLLQKYVMIATQLIIPNQIILPTHWLNSLQPALIVTRKQPGFHQLLIITRFIHLLALMQRLCVPYVIQQDMLILRILVPVVIPITLTRQQIPTILQRNFRKHAKPVIHQLHGFLLLLITLRFIRLLDLTQQFHVSRVIPPDILILRIPVPVVIPMITIRQQIPTIQHRFSRKHAKPAIHQLPGFRRHSIILRFTRSPARISLSHVTCVMQMVIQTLRQHA
jgi:hypothetical protein